MSQEILEKYSTYFKLAIQQISLELLEKEFETISTIEDKVFEGQKKLDVILGITGDYKGRLLLETTEKTARIITELMNYGPLEEENDLYFFMGEYVNILSGRAITFINNSNDEKKVRLTPPAIFTGLDLEITTPNIQSVSLCFGRENIQLKMNIGFEGV